MSYIPKKSILIGIALAAAIGTVLLLLRQSQKHPNGGVFELVRAAKRVPRRTFDGRLTGGFAWTPPLKPSRAAAAVNDESTWPVAEAASSLPADDHHSRGAAFLLTGDVDKAVANLEENAKREPNDASTWSDLSAAYNARGKAHNYALDYAASLDTAEHAWCLNHTAEGAWNRAIALSSLRLDRLAKKAWGDVLATEPDPSWRREAQERRAETHELPGDDWKRLERLLATDASSTAFVDEAVTTYPAQTLAFFERVIVPQWALAQRNGNTARAAAKLEVARRIAVALAQTGERLPAAGVAAIDQACRSNTGCTAIATAHLTHDESVRAMDGQGYGAAMAPLQESARVFEANGSPYAFASRFQIAVCMIHENGFADARKALAQLRTAVTGLHYRTLEARASMVEGLAALHDARPEESIAAYAASRDLFSEGHDVRNLATVETRLADAFEFAGDRDEAMDHRLAAFDAINRCGDTSELYLALFEAGTSLENQRWHYAADLLLSEATREALATRHRAVAAISSMWRSSIASTRGDFASAGAEAKLAALYSAQTADTGQRALVAATERQLGRPSAAERDVASGITEAIEFFRAGGNRAWLPQLLRQRALAELARGDVTGAERDLRQAVDVSEDVLDDAAPATMREGFAIDTRSAYEDLIRLLLRRGASQEALVYAERARCTGQGRQNAKDVLISLSRLPPLTSIAVIEVQGDELIVWLVSRGAIQTFRSRERNLDTRIEDAAKTLPNDNGLETLYDLLASSWITHVPARSRLLISPPPALTDIPFPGLRERDSHRSLIDDYTIEIAQSLSSAIEPPIKVAKDDRAVIVGDPAYHDLPQLPHTREEAVAIARLYPHSTLLLDHAATPENVLPAIARAQIFHFGGHAVLNDLAPELSSLMLSADHDSHESRLYLRELAARKMPLNLVVLSACSTAARPRQSRRTLTLARAFLQAGARSVVGTLWPIPDEAASVFSRRLHESMSRGETVAEALREAQLDMKARSNGDLSWAAFCLLTASARRGGACDD